MSGAIGRYQGHKADLNMTMVCARSLAGIVGVTMQFCIMGMTGVFAVWRYVTIGSIVAVTQLSGSVISPATELSDKISKLKSTYPILDRLDELSGTPGARKEVAVREPRRSIELDDVSFSYGEGAWPRTAPPMRPRSCATALSASTPARSMPSWEGAAAASPPCWAS